MTLLSCALLLSLLRYVWLVLTVFIATTELLCAAICLPLSSQFSFLFKWDDIVDGVQQPSALDLHLVLSVSFFSGSCVSPKPSVVGRRLFRPVRALATC